MAVVKQALFKDQNFINLETFYKNGRGVKTPVWFVEVEGRLYIRTLADSWKVRRIRSTPRVRVVPSRAQGIPLADWVEGQARVVDQPEIEEQVNQLLKLKYGAQKAMFELLGKFSRRAYTTLEITL